MHDLSVGHRVEAQRLVTQTDFDRFAVLSDDDNPIHIDTGFAARTKFGKTVAHGMFLYSLVCQVLGENFPGMLQLSQDLMFPNPTFAENEITIQLTVSNVQRQRDVASVETVITRPDDEVVLQGHALIQVPPYSGRIDSLTHQPSLADNNEQEPFKGLKLGQRAETVRLFALADLAEYRDLLQDKNRLHYDLAYARSCGFANVLIPNGLIGAMFSYLLGTALPGRGTNYLKQRLNFEQPAYPEQEITASVEISRIRREKHLVSLITRCVNPIGETICWGEALVMVSDINVQ